MKNDSTIICGLDVGTTKVCMMITRVNNDGSLELIGSGHAHSAGLKNGVVVDLEKVADAIRKAAEEAEREADVSVDWVTVSAAGDHFQSFNSHAVINIAGPRPEVTYEEMSRVINTAAQSVQITPDREILHVLPQEFFLDGRGGTQRPIGLSGSQFEVNVHVVTCMRVLNQNLINAVNRARMRVKKVVLQPLADAEAVITEDEKELGTVLINIGGGTTSIAVFRKNAVQFTRVLPVGGVNFTHDLAIVLQTPIEDAERIKKESGTVLTERIQPGETVNVPVMGVRRAVRRNNPPEDSAGISETETIIARPVPREKICGILRARAMELLELVADQLRKAAGNDFIVERIIVTGGGSMLEGMTELAEEVFSATARHGLPGGIQGLTENLSLPRHATAIGLTLFELNEVKNQEKAEDKKPGIIRRILLWIRKKLGI